MFDHSQLKEPTGQFRTLSLFWEFRHVEGTALFTIKDDAPVVDGKTYISLKRIYLSYDDPTEWEFVQVVFGNWRHWEKLLGNKKIRSFINQWRAEQEIKLRSKGIKSLLKLSKDKESAAKWLAEGKWKGSRGRPSKDEVARETRIQAGIEQDLAEHWERLMTETPATNRAN